MKRLAIFAFYNEKGLINDYVVDKFDDIVFQNEQEGETKEHRLAKSLKKDFTKEILGKRRWQLVE